jgi:hypothetical protein
LAFDILESAESDASSYDSHDEQTDTCESLRKKQMTEVAIRLIIGVIAFPLGCLLLCRSEGRLLSWIGTALVAIGVGAFFLPVYLQTCKQDSEYRLTFQHDGENVSQRRLYVD